jgi:hypothetical protein
MRLRLWLFTAALLTFAACASSKDAARQEEQTTTTSAATQGRQADTGAAGGQLPDTGAGTAQPPDAGAGIALVPDTGAAGLSVVDTAAASVAGAEKPARVPDVIYVPTPDTVVNEMLKVAKVTKKDFLYDLGSGDGRIVIAAARDYGIRGIGIDIDPQRISEARENARKARVEDRVKFLQQDLFTSEFDEATVVTLYLLPDLNIKLRPMLFDQLKPGTRVVSHAFSMGEWEPDSAFEVDSRQVMYWVIPANIAGTWKWNTSGDSKPWKGELQITQRFQRPGIHFTLDGEIFNVTDVELEGDRLSFTATGRVGGEDVTLQFNGRVAGDAITGRVRAVGGPAPGEKPWKAKRTKRSDVPIAADSVAGISRFDPTARKGH